MSVLLDIAMDAGQFVHDAAVVVVVAALFIGAGLLLKSEIKDLSRWSEKDLESAREV